MSASDPGPSRDGHLTSGTAAPQTLYGSVRVVLCDADGNLFPSEEPAFEASVKITNRFLAEHGVDRRYGSEELRLASTGMNYRRILVALALQHHIPLAAGLDPTSNTDAAPSAGAAHALTAESLEEWVALEKQAVTQHLATVLRPDPDVLGPLAALAVDYGLAAVSSSADTRIEACFEVTGMSGYFPADRRFSAEDSLPVPTSKPDPAIYLHAGQVLGVGLTEAVAVEDSITGATSAVAAGFATIGNLQFVQPGEREARRAALEEVGVVAIVTSWGEIVELLTR